MRDVREQRREQILDAAKLVFSRKGFHTASVTDIVEEAGVARGTFYLYFKGKRDIFDSLLEELLGELRRRIRPIVLEAGGPAPLEQLKANIRGVLELVISDPKLMQLLLHHAAGLDRRSSETIRDFYDRIGQMIERSLEQGMALGLLRRCDARINAVCILGMIREVADWLTASRHIPPPLDTIVDEIIGFGLTGLFLKPDATAGAPDA